MAKDIFDSILEKKYDQLSSSELNELQEFCSSEVEFNSLKEIILRSKAISNAPKLTSTPETKVALDAIFLANHPAKTNRFPYIAVAATILVALFAVWMFFQSNQPEKIQHANNNEEEKIATKEESKLSTEKHDNTRRNIDTNAPNLLTSNKKDGTNHSANPFKQPEENVMPTSLLNDTQMVAFSREDNEDFSSNSATFNYSDSILFAKNELNNKSMIRSNELSKKEDSAQNLIKSDGKLSGFISPSASATNMAPPRTLHFAGSLQKSMSVHEQKDILQFLQPKF